MKNLPIKAIVTTQLFEEKQQIIIIHKTGLGLVRGGSHMTYPLSPRVMHEIFLPRTGLYARTIVPHLCIKGFLEKC
jgi:hypothetical protein